MSNEKEGLGLNRVLEKLITGLFAGVVITTSSMSYNACGYELYNKQTVDTVQKIPDVPFHLKKEYQAPKQNDILKDRYEI